MAGVLRCPHFLEINRRIVKWFGEWKPLPMLEEKKVEVKYVSQAQLVEEKEDIERVYL